MKSKGKYKSSKNTKFEFMTLFENKLDKYIEWHILNIHRNYKKKLFATEDRQIFEISGKTPNFLRVKNRSLGENIGLH